MVQTVGKVHPFNSLPFLNAPIATSGDIAAATYFWILTPDNELKRALIADISSLQYKLPYSGAQPLPFADRASALISIKEFGAKGTGETTKLGDLYGTIEAAKVDYPGATSLTNYLDWAALTNAASICRGTTRGLEIPDGTFMMGANTADLKGIANIQCTGILVSNVPSGGVAAEIGTVGNANSDLVGASITLRVMPEGSAQKGATGIRVKGLYRARLRLFSDRFNTGIWFNPTSEAGIQFVSDVLVEQLGVYSADVAVLLDHNTFIANMLLLNVGLSPGLVNTPFAGVRLGNGDTSAVIFEQPDISGWPTPIRASTGRSVYFRKARLANSGPIVIEGAATSQARMIVVETSQKGDPTKLVHPVQFNGKYPCFSVGSLGVSWHPELFVNSKDFFNYNPLTDPTRKQYTPKLISKNTPGHFESVTVDASAGTFTLSQNDQAYYYSPVSKGDVLWPRVQYLRGVPPGTMQVLTLTACDANKNPLATIGALDPTQTPYLGMGSDEVNGWDSGVGNALIIQDANAGSELYVSVNRTEVKFLRVELMPGVVYGSLTVSRILRDLGDMNSLLTTMPVADIKYINDPTTDPPDRFGQFGVLRGNQPKFYFANTPTTWMNVDSNIASYGPAASRPTTLGTYNAGWRHFDTDLERDVVWTGVAWDDPVSDLDLMVIS